MWTTVAMNEGLTHISFETNPLLDFLLRPPQVGPIPFRWSDFDEACLKHVKARFSTDLTLSDP